MRACLAAVRMRALCAVCFLLLALWESADRLGFTSGHCSAQQVQVRALDSWKLEARWNTSGETQTHEVQVARTSLFEVLFQGNVSSGVLVWRSSLPLECTYHSVRIRPVYNSTFSSTWSEWATNKGERNVSSDKARLFPDGKLLQERSPAYCCCIPPIRAQVTQILFRNKPYPLITIDSSVRAILVPEVTAPMSMVSFICRDSTGAEQSVLNYVTFPPERLKNLSCWTSDLQSVRCSWTVTRRPNMIGRQRRQYALHIHGSGEAEVRCDVNLCVFPVVPNRSFYNISVRVNNSLGEQNQSYAFNISHRVFPVLEDVLVQAGVTDALVSWFLNGNFTGLNFTCQFTLDPAGTTTELVFVVNDPEQRVSVCLQPLQPSCQYSTSGRCAVQGSSWGPWSPVSRFSTEPLVTLDIWMKIRHQANERSVTVLWKISESGLDSVVEVFEVCVEQDGPRRRVCVNVTELQVELAVGLGVCNVSVRAITLRGSSLSSLISVPALHSELMLKEKRIVGNSEGFLLSWSPSSSVTCGYTVEWCLMGNAVPCDLQWRKVSANQTSLFLGAGGFRKGRRYTFKIYRCQTEGHQVHEKHTGYLEEQRPVSAPELLESLNARWSSVALQWSFNEDDPAHPGFITGYNLTIYTHTNPVECVWVEDPHCKVVRVEGLQEGQVYGVRLAACTRAGCGAESVHTIRTLQNHYLLLVKVVTPLLILIGCCVCLWPCRKTLKGIVEDIFSFPSDHSLKILELNDSLYEVSEKLRVLQVEDCRWCSLEVVEVRSSVEEKARLVFTGGDAEPPDQSVTAVTNLTYLSGLQVELLPHSPETPQPSGYVRVEDPGLSTSDYVTSVTMATM
ncbi:leukemia inhibitory factor receptor isoform X2 [Astyanax mexicanus]|uniref:leukemia inhibitory factor receptor isoform X2 n=1 Tax=Astyanax mexicanus TaxID=7994 RepID=UPI0020CB55D9|nr:leukemia inhibitory factor receptor isoform X2 [Astyanax mexicanus]